MKVTIAVIPRERFSFVKPALEGIYEHTRHPFDLVYVDCASPPATRDYIAGAAKKHGFSLIRTEYILTPNEARNLALSEIDTEYVVFIDNDALASPGWLAKLVPVKWASPMPR